MNRKVMITNQGGGKFLNKVLWHFSNGDSISGCSGYNKSQVQASLVLLGTGSAPSDTYWENLAKSIDALNVILCKTQCLYKSIYRKKIQWVKNCFIASHLEKYILSGTCCKLSLQYFPHKVELGSKRVTSVGK